jgi:ABC-type branched-subunit amino acid transport system substrate-binding protein
MRQGILAAFEDANRHGGVSGRTLELRSLDDGYEPERTVEATKRIIEEDKVFAIVGAVGTPTSKAGQPIATAAKVPFIGPFTGAEFLRNPYNRYVVNIRASYFQETEAWVEAKRTSDTQHTMKDAPPLSRRYRLFTALRLSTEGYPRCRNAPSIPSSMRS